MLTSLIYPFVFTDIKQMNKREFLAIAEEHIYLLDKSLTMWTKISLTATETPLPEKYMIMWNTCHGNKIEIHNE